MYRLLALDIDGTLLNSEGEVCDSTRDAIERVQGENIIVTISTGRPIQGVNKYIELLNLRAPIITYNGAMIIDSVTQEVIYEQKLSDLDARQVFELGKAYDMTMIVWSNNKLYVNRMDDKVKDYQTLSGEVPIEIQNEELIYKQGVTKIIWISSPDKLIEVQKELKGTLNESITSVTSKAHYLEFFNSKVSKSKALAFIGNRFNIQKEEMIAIGDGNNDIDMIEYVGMGVAMENATDGVKAVSNYITTSNDDNGIFNALVKLI